MKLADLLKLGKARGYLDENRFLQIEQTFRQQGEEKPKMPWHFQALVILGAWLSALFFVGFFGTLGGGFLTKSPALCFSTGVTLIAIATLFSRFQPGLFLRQILLTLSATGHILVFIAVGHRTNDIGLLLLTSAILTSILYFAYRDDFHRFCSMLVTLAFSTAWIHEHHKAQYFLDPISTFLHGITLGLIFFRPGTSQALRPVGYAIAISLLGLVGTGYSSSRIPAFLPTSVIHHIPYILALLFLAIWAVGWNRTKSKSLLSFKIAGIILVLGLVANPGTLFALCLLIAGFGLQDRILSALGIVFLPVFITEYYYNLKITLMEKSLILAASGLLLLLLRLWIGRMRFEEAEQGKAIA